MRKLSAEYNLYSYIILYTCVKLGRVLRNKCAVISVILLAVHSVLQVVNCSTLSGNHYRESQDHASNLKTAELLLL